MAPMTRFRHYAGLAWKVLLFAGFLLVASRLGDWVTAQVTPHLTPSTEPAVHRFILLAVATYVLLMMLPFVPGIELGLGMMAMFGPKIVPLIYGCTVLALVLSFLVGRLVPQGSIADLFRTLHMRRTSNLLEQVMLPAAILPSTFKPPYSEKSSELSHCNRTTNWDPVKSCRERLQLTQKFHF